MPTASEITFDKAKTRNQVLGDSQRIWEFQAKLTCRLSADGLADEARFRLVRLRHLTNACGCSLCCRYAVERLSIDALQKPVWLPVNGREAHFLLGEALRQAVETLSAGEGAPAPSVTEVIGSRVEITDHSGRIDLSGTGTPPLVVDVPEWLRLQGYMPLPPDERWGITSIAVNKRGGEWMLSVEMIHEDAGAEVGEVADG